MPSRRRIPEYIQQQVRERADGLCEYCHTIEKWQYILFTMDHVTPLSQGGDDTFENLALACLHCNRHKWHHTLGIDPITNLTHGLFNPRRDIWSTHFIWSADGATIIGMTPIGRATIEQLDLNRLRIVSIRLTDVAIGRHPPQADPVMQIEA
ncbi:MAG: HNH endonuclease [Caldilineaceae bacterium]